jgi:hypothetical protein
MVDLTRTLTAAALAVTATISPAKAETTFLEAAMFFITGVDATSEDTVSEDEIRLHRYPIVAYLAGNCAVRIRMTTAPSWVYKWISASSPATNGVHVPEDGLSFGSDAKTLFASVRAGTRTRTTMAPSMMKTRRAIPWAGAIPTAAIPPGIQSSVSTYSSAKPGDAHLSIA